MGRSLCICAVALKKGKSWPIIPYFLSFGLAMDYLSVLTHRHSLDSPSYMPQHDGEHAQVCELGGACQRMVNGESSAAFVNASSAGLRGRHAAHH